MVLSFNWHKYSFIVGLLKKEIGAATMQHTAHVKQGPGGPEECEGQPLEGSRFGSEGAGKWSCKVGEIRPEQPESGLMEACFRTANKAKTELGRHIRSIAVKKPGREELLLYLRQLISPYKILRFPHAYPFQIAINNAIEQDAREYCSIHLSEMDLLLLWQDIK